MDTTGIKLDDLMEVEIRGQRIVARFRGRADDGRALKMAPIAARITERSCKPTQVVGIYRATVATRRRKGLA